MTPSAVEPPPAPSSRPVIARGLKLAMMGCGALFVFGIVFAVTWGFLLMRNPKIREVVGAIRDGAGIMVKGATAPGTEELRKAGCTTAFALDVAQLASIIARAKIGAPEQATRPVPQHPVVMCMPKATPSLTCDQVARVYGGAVDSAEPFGVVVRVRSDNEPACQGLFDAAGNRLGDLEGDTRHVATE